MYQRISDLDQAPAPDPPGPLAKNPTSGAWSLLILTEVQTHHIPNTADDQYGNTGEIYQLNKRRGGEQTTGNNDGGGGSGDTSDLSDSH